MSSDSITLEVTREAEDILNENAATAPCSTDGGKSTIPFASAITNGSPRSSNIPVNVEGAGPKRRSKHVHGSGSDAPPGMPDSFPAERVEVGSHGNAPAQSKTPALAGPRPANVDRHGGSADDRSPDVAVGQQKTPKWFALPRDVSQPATRPNSIPAVLPPSPPAAVAIEATKIQSSSVVQMKSQNSPSKKQKPRTKSSDGDGAASNKSKMGSELLTDKNDNVASLFDALNQNFSSLSATNDSREQNRNSWRNSSGTLGQNRESYGFDSLYSRNQPFPVEVSLLPICIHY